MQHNVIETEQATESLARVSLPADDLWRAAKLLSSKLIDKRAHSAFQAIRFDVSPDGAAMVSASNSETFASVAIEASCMGDCVPGSFAVDGKALADAMAKARKAREFVALECESRADAFNSSQRDKPAPYRVNLKAGRTVLALKGVAIEDLPVPPTVGIDAPKGALALNRLAMDLKALSPAMSKDESRYYLQGVAIQRRELAGRDRLCMVATNGHMMAAASRAIPNGLEATPDCILPAAAVQFIIAAAKVAEAVEGATLSVESERMAITFGNVQIVALLIAGTYPDWPRAFDMVATPTEGIEGPLFPELLPGRPLGQMVQLEKAFPGAIEWIEGAEGVMGVCAGDPGIAWAVTKGTDAMEPKKGYSYTMTGEGRALDYLSSLAEQQGLRDFAAIKADCEVISRDRDNHATAYATRSLQTVGGRIVGMTVQGRVNRYAWTERVQDWEALCYRDVHHPASEEAIEGSYSVLMPAEGPQLESEYAVTVEGDRTYPLATNSSNSAIHIDKSQVAALCGDDLWNVIEVQTANGPRYVSEWLYNDGDSRLLCVGKDGRCPKGDAPREYLTREQVDAALAGEPVAIEAEPVAEAVTPTADTEGEGATVGIERPKRSPAHERAIRRAWEMRKRLRSARYEAELQRTMSGKNHEFSQAMREDRDKVQRQLEAALATAQDHLAMREALQVELRQAARDRDVWAERAATWEAKWKDAEQRAQAAQAENAQLWQEIEALTAPAERQAA